MTISSAQQSRARPTAILACLCLSGTALADQHAGDFYNPVPKTVSPEAQAFIGKLPDPATYPARPAPDDLDGWKALRDRLEAEAEPGMQALRERYGHAIVASEIGTVPVLDIRPDGWKNSDQAIVFLHGGGYTLGSAASSLAASLPLAEAAKRRVISVDYTTAPQAKFAQILDEISRVIRGLHAQGYEPENLGLLGVSAGGGLAVGVTHWMRDLGQKTVGAIVLWSPAVDLSDGGDTWETLRRAELAFPGDSMDITDVGLALASADQLRNPYVSPVYGRFGRDFPPTLVQGGTREMMLSGFVRLFRAIDSSGGQATLDLYEGMVHAFQEVAFELPESDLARQNTARFFQQHLR